MSMSMSSTSGIGLFCSLVRSLQDRVRDGSFSVLGIRRPARRRSLSPSLSPPPKPEKKQPGGPGAPSPEKQPQLSSSEEKKLRPLPKKDAKGAPVVPRVQIPPSQMLSESAPACDLTSLGSGVPDEQPDLTRDGVFPRGAEFYGPLLVSMGFACRGVVDEAVLVIAQWMPASQHLAPEHRGTLSIASRNDALKWRFFVESFGDSTAGVPLDFLEAVATLASADVLAHILRDLAPGALQKRTLAVLLELALASFRPRSSLSLSSKSSSSSSASPSSPLASILVALAAEQFAYVLWEISPHCLGEITTKAKDLLSGVLPEEGLSYYRGLLGVRMNVSAPELAELSLNFLAAIVEWLRTPKKTQTRAVQLDLLGNFVLSGDFAESSSRLREFAKESYRRVSDALRKNEDLEPHAMRALAAILSRCPEMAEEFEAFSKKLVKAVAAPKKKDWALTCMRTLLRGRQCPVRSSWQPCADPETAAAASREALVRASSYRVVADAAREARLLDLSLTVFNNKTGPPRAPELIDDVAGFMTQVAAHNLKFAAEHIFLPLADSAAPFQLLLALRGLARLIQSEVFWDVAPSAMDKTSPHYVSPEVLIQMLNKTVLKALDICNSQAMLSQPGDGSEAFTVASPPKGRPLVPQAAYQLPSPEETAVGGETAAALRQSLHRWQEVAAKPPAKREAEAEAALRRSQAAMQATVESWFVRHGISPLMADSCVTPRPLLSGPRSKSKKQQQKAADTEVLLLCREFLLCQAVSAETVAERLGEKHTIGVGLMNDDEGIVAATGHMIERMIVNFPPIRPVVVANVVRFLDECDPRKAFTATLLSHLLSFLDLMATCLVATANARPAQLLSEDQLSQVESTVLVCMASNIPAVQITCLRVLSVLPVITSPGKQKQGQPLQPPWSQELAEHQEELCTAAKLAFLKHSSPAGAATPRFIEASAESDAVDTPALTFEAFASVSAALPRLYSCLLEAIGKFTASRASGLPLLSRIRALCFKKLAFFDVTDPVTLKTSTSLIWRNLATILFSTAGVPPSAPSERAKSELAELVPTLGMYLQKIWDRLVDDGGELAEALVSLCCQCHFHSVPVFVATLLQWWRLVHDNPRLHEKRKAALFHDVIALLRSITDADNFRGALEVNSEIVWHLVPLLEQLPSSFGAREQDAGLERSSSTSSGSSLSQSSRGRVSPAPGSSSASPSSANPSPTFAPVLVSGSSSTIPASSAVVPPLDNRVLPFARLVSNFCRLVRNICGVLEKPPCVVESPVRARVFRAIDPTFWKTEGRRTLVEKLIHWSTGGDLGASEQGRRLEAVMGLVSQVRLSAKLAAEAVIRLGPLTAAAEPLPRRIVEWAMENESPTTKILRWICVFHFDRVLPQFMAEIFSSKGVGPGSGVSVVAMDLIESIYERFCILDEDDPKATEGGTAGAAAGAVPERSAPTADIRRKDEDSIARDLAVYGGALVHLCLRNLVSSNAKLRGESFAVISALAPLGFGAAAVPDDAMHLRLVCHRGGIRSHEPLTYEAHALAVSEVVATCCQPLTTALFSHAFSTAATMGVDQKRKTLRYLAPWCDNVVLNEATFRTTGSAMDMSLETFIEAPFRDFSVDLATAGHMQPMTGFWVRLARKAPETNVPVIANFLVRAASQEDRHVQIVKTIVLALFDAIGDALPSVIVSKLSFDQVSKFIEYIPAAEALPSASANTSSLTSLPLISARDAKAGFSREVVASILVDLLSHNFRGLMKHLPVILSFSMLHHDDSAVFREVLAVVFENVLIECEQSGRASGDIFAATSKVAKMLERSAVLWFGARRHNSKAVPEASRRVAVEEVVRCLCEYLKVLDQQVIEGWSYEVFMWASDDRGRPNLRREARATRLLRALSAYIGLPSRKLIRDLSTSLLGACELSDKFSARRTSCSPAPDASQQQPEPHPASTRLPAAAEDGSVLADAAVKAEEILLTFEKFTELLNLKAEKTSHSLMFWCAVACLLNPEERTATMYAEALSLLRKMDQRGLLRLMNQVTDFEALTGLLHREGFGKQFVGLERLVMRGLMRPATQQESVMYLATAVVGTDELFTPANAMSPLPAANRDAFAVLGVLPVVLSILSAVKRRLAPAGLLAFAGDLADALGRSQLRCPRTAEVLRSVAVNAGAASIETVLATVVGEVHDVALPAVAPECFELWHEMVQCGAPTIAEAALEVAARVLSIRPADLAQYYAALARPIVQHVTTFGPAVPAATRLVWQISAAAVTSPSVVQRDPSREVAALSSAPSSLSPAPASASSTSTPARQAEPPGPRFPASTRVVRQALLSFEKKTSSRKSVAPKALWKHFSEKICDMPGRNAPKPPLPQPLAPLEGLGDSSLTPRPLLPESPRTFTAPASSSPPPEALVAPSDDEDDGDEEEGASREGGIPIPKASTVTSSSDSPLPPSLPFSPSVLQDSTAALGFPVFPAEHKKDKQPQKSSLASESIELSQGASMIGEEAGPPSRHSDSESGSDSESPEVQHVSK